jgi:hypothetical protein
VMNAFFGELMHSASLELPLPREAYERTDPERLVRTYGLSARRLRVT